MSARTPKYSCAPPAARRKPTNTSSKIRTIPRSVQTSRKRLQPGAVGLAIEMAGAGTVDQRGIAGRIGVGVQRLQRVDQHAGDVAARPQHMERPLGHLGQRIGLVRRNRVADAGLHVAPPAVIGAGETNQMRAAGVVAGKPHRLHHRFGAGHVERDFVEPRYFAEPSHVIEDDRVIGPEHRSKRMRARLRLARCIPCRSRCRRC